MDAELLALFAQMIDTGVTLSFEAARRKKSKENRRIAETLRALDPQMIWDDVSPVTLAGYMQGGVTAANVKQLMQKAEFKAISRELFLACIADPTGHSAVSTAKTSLEVFTASELSSHASADDARAFATAIADSLIDLSRAASVSLHETDPSLAQQLSQTALLKRMMSLLEVIGSHNEALVRLTAVDSGDERKRFLDSYRTACVEWHGSITPPDFDTQRKVPLEQLYVAPRLRHLDASDSDPGLSASEFLPSIDRNVVLGDPGGGKSTLSAYIVTRLAKTEAEILPLHVTLRKYAPLCDELSLLEFIERELKSLYQVDPIPGLVKDLLVSGRAFVVFDGLDELMDASARRDVSRRIEVFGALYPHTPILVTSRRVGYEQAQLDPGIFSPYHIDGFEDAEVEQYVQNWFQSQPGYGEHEAIVQSASFIQQSEAVPDLRRNPLMLALMCIIFRGENYIPRNRPAVYEKCATLLFEKWDGHRDIVVPLQARDHVDAAMKFIAYQFISEESGDVGIEERRVVSMLAEYLHHRAVDTTDNAQQAAKEFVDYCAGRAWVFTDAGLTGADERIFTFTHRTFMEYFAAVHLTRITDTPEALAGLLLPHVAREEWDVVAQLAVQQIDSKTDQGTTRALTAMLEERRRRSTANRGHVLAFIARCMAFAVVTPALVREITSACARHALSQTSTTGVQGETTRPLSILRAVTSGPDAEYAAGQYAADLHAALAVEGSRRNALLVAMHWLTVGQLRDMAGVKTEHHWRLADISLATTHRELLSKSAKPESMIPQLFAWHGIDTAEQGSEYLRSSSASFAERYFDDQALNGAILGPSLSELLLRSADFDWDSREEFARSWALTFSESLVQDFHGMDRHLPSLTHRRRVSARRLLVRYSTSYQGEPTPVIDALLVSQIASAELVVATIASRTSHARQRGQFIRRWSRDGQIEPLGELREHASDEIARFATEWLERKSTVFTNSLIHDERARPVRARRQKQIPST